MATIELGSKRVDVAAGAYRLRYEPGYAIVTLTSGKMLVVSAGVEPVLHLALGGPQPTVRLVPGRLGLHPIDEA